LISLLKFLGDPFPWRLGLTVAEDAYHEKIDQGDESFASATPSVVSHATLYNVIRACHAAWQVASSAALAVTPEHRQELERIARSGKTEQRMAARIVVGAADGKSNNALAKELKTSRPTVLDLAAALCRRWGQSSL
jgi:DNA-binding NarL/FixJ family response regulator